MYIQSFEELVTLAEAGSHEKLDSVVSDLVSGPDDPYSVFPPSVLAYAFKKVQGRKIGEYTLVNLFELSPTSLFSSYSVDQAAIDLAFRVFIYLILFRTLLKINNHALSLP